ncbi:hypothetical protein [Micromonospora inyonensis]|uniref:Uncharacterized protein n=1 Tax=Micromonospora inyonensis TaxID=47866 RepID=A0A1C6RCY8_9ACTN|nr:hypothetical protein [Micromonospora inyonensis]SCL15014.1 hypothetical protein GA0074694_1015 [Micromonospora inyonensis]
MSRDEISNRIVELLVRGLRYRDAHMQAHREANTAAANAWHASPAAE